jgi:serine/alanine adding enzyme
MAVDKNDVVKGALPLTQLKSRLFGNLYCAVPFFNYDGVLADNDIIETQLINYAWLTASANGSQHIENRHTHELSNLPCRDDKVSMILELPEQMECLWHNFVSKQRAQINKAETNKHQVKYGKHELVDDFYQVFAHKMRNLGTPMYSKKLFINMLLYWYILQFDIEKKYHCFDFGRSSKTHLTINLKNNGVRKSNNCIGNTA